jgi:putative acetyltransferase
MIEVRRIKPHEWPAAKRVIYRVAHEVFSDPRPLEESIAYYESRSELRDLDDIQTNYFENGGIFLVMLDGNEMIGTGAIRQLEDRICELKRLWLLSEFHGKSLGYRMLQELLSFAREKGYQRIRLETDPVSQSRALDFYRRIGFYEIPRYTDRTDDIAMELPL